MSYRSLENGNPPSVEVEDGTEARLALEALVDSAGHAFPAERDSGGSPRDQHDGKRGLRALTFDDVQLLVFEHRRRQAAEVGVVLDDQYGERPCCFLSGAHDWLAGLRGFELANPPASYLTGIPWQLCLKKCKPGGGDPSRVSCVIQICSSVQHFSRRSSERRTPRTPKRRRTNRAMSVSDLPDLGA